MAVTDDWQQFSGRVDERPACFSPDGSKVFAPSGDLVRIHFFQ